MHDGCAIQLLANKHIIALAGPKVNNVYACAQVELNGRGLSSLVASANAPHVRPGEQTDSVVLNVQRMHRQVPWSGMPTYGCQQTGTCFVCDIARRVCAEPEGDRCTSACYFESLGFGYAIRYAHSTHTCSTWPQK
jgi:hypothetical protein